MEVLCTEKKAASLSLILLLNTYSRYLNSVCGKGGFREKKEKHDMF